MITRLIFIVFIPHVLFAQSPTSDSSRKTIKINDLSHISHYSGYFKGLRSSGHMVSDDNNNLISKSMYCTSFEDSTIFYYQLIKYFKNQEVKYDSILDFRRKRIAKASIVHKSETGEIKYSIKLKAKLDPHRKDIPIRSETLWFGREIYYDEQGTKTKRKIRGEVR